MKKQNLQERPKCMTKEHPNKKKAFKLFLSFSSLAYLLLRLIIYCRAFSLGYINWSNLPEKPLSLLLWMLWSALDTTRKPC